ncbi:MAG: PAS domain-containing protein [Desulfobacterales bacterium]|nr:PAS domain-containing protein [Desulfobacterales bacterium]
MPESAAPNNDQESTDLREEVARLTFALRGANSGIWDWNLKTGAVFFDENYFRIADYAPDEFAHSYESWSERVHPDDLKKAERKIKAYLSGKSDIYSAEFRFRTKSNQWMWILGQGKIIEYNEKGEPIRFTGTHHDITARKKTEQDLKKSYETLEEKVRERTAELNEMNTALKVLLKKREHDREDIEEKIFANFKLRVTPTLDRLKKEFSGTPRSGLITLLESELNDILSGFSKKMSDPTTGLTPMEVQIASMIKLGKSSKEIARLLNRSAYTIANHRENIRKKLGLKNRKVNLRSFLSNP